MVKFFLPWLQNHPYFTAIAVGVLAGVFEELLFRGPIQTAFVRKFKPLTAIIITALLFAAMHLDLHGLGLRALLGVILGYLVWRSGSILPAILAHGLYDTVSLLMSAWHLRRYGLTTPAPLFDARAIMMLLCGTVMVAAAFWILTRRDKTQVGFDVKE